MAATDEFAAFAAVPKAQLIGESLFRYFPDNPDVPNVSDDIRSSLAKCIAGKQRNELAAQRYDIANPDGTFREMYWTVIHTPILDDSGMLTAIVHTAVEVTDTILSTIKDEKIKSFQAAHDLFMQSTMAIHIFKGEDLIVELANEPTMRLWGRDNSVIGKPLREVLPELKSQAYIEIIDQVRLTGIPYLAHEASVVLHRNGKDETAYVNFMLQPYYEDGHIQPVGVIALVSEVSGVSKKEFDEKKRSLELAVEIGDLGTFNIDFRNNVVSFSPQIMEWLNTDSPNLPLSDLVKIIHPDDYTKVGETLAQILNGSSGRKHDLTFRVVHPENSEVQYMRSIGQVYVKDGEAAGLSGIVQDITGSVKSRMALEESAQRLRSFIDSAPFPIGVYIGKEMRVEMVNQAILDVWDKKDVIGKRYADVLPELAGQGIYEQLDLVYTTGKAFNAYHQRVDIEVAGTLQSFYFNYVFTPLFDANGKVYGVMNTAAEVTDLVLTQNALRESERNFRLMILQAPVAMCQLSGPEHIIEVANESMIELWGKPEKSVMNKPVFEALPDAKEQGLEQLLAHVYRTGEMITANERPVVLLRHGKEETVYQNFVYDAYRDGNGNILGVLASTIDVTDQVRARFKIEEMVSDRTRELEQSNSSLQQSNAELEQFAYIASHDLQEPLRKINMFTGMLQRVLGDNDAAQNHMRNINNSVNRMTNLIRDILSYSQLSQKHDSFERTSLEQIFAEVITDFDLIAEEKNAVIMHNRLPQIDAIPLQMTQLFHNLISNALKYSKPDEKPVINIVSEKLTTTEALNLGLVTQIVAPYYKISFQDNGIGFSQEYAVKIFNIFQRLHAKGKYEGTGIGLAMCKKIAENHHGMIYAESAEGTGTTFTVVLPSLQND